MRKKFVLITIQSLLIFLLLLTGCTKTSKDKTGSSNSSLRASSSSSQLPANNSTQSPSESSSESSSPSSTNISVSSVDFNKRNITLIIGETFKLLPKFTPSNSTDKTLKWTTSNSGIASVDNTGTITAKSPGTSYIHATASNGQRDTCTVTVAASANKNNSNAVATKEVTTNGANINAVGATDTLHSPLTEILITKVIDGYTLQLQLKSDMISGQLTLKNYYSYNFQHAFYKVTENDNGKVIIDAMPPRCNDEINFVANLETYSYESQNWLKPATYTVKTYVAPDVKDEYYHTPDDATLLDTFSFSVYERGFK